MFTLTAQESKIAHLNFREEKHGDESVIAVDIKVTTAVSNDFLSYLSSTLKQSLYGVYDNAQGQLVHDNPGYLPRLLYPEVKQIRWSGEMNNAQVVIHGAKKKNDLHLTAAVNNLRLECMDGGTVVVTFRVQLVPDDDQRGKLSGMLGMSAKITIAAADDPLPAGEDLAEQAS